MDVREKLSSVKRLEEMSEYIKKDELLKFKADVYDEDGHVLYAVPTGCIVAMPPADVVLVRHGRWERVIPSKSAAKWSTKVSCSNCHNAGYTRYKYCPNCGCLMLGGED